MPLMAASGTILVVDDEEGILKLLETLLSEAGYCVVVADSGEKAIAVTEGEQIDVALVDKNLPDMDGVELVRKLGEAHPGMVAAIMTGYGSLRSSLDALDVGVARYLLKPFDDIALVTRTVWDILQERDVRVRRRTSLCDVSEEGVEEAKAVEEPPIRIVVGDSLDQDREELAGALEAAGCDVTRATCAQEALLKLGAGGHEVLVVGYDMGDMTADDVLLRAKRVSPEVAVVVTSEHPTLSMTTSLIRRGAAGFMEKPFKDKSRTAQSILRHGQAARRRIQALADERAKATAKKPAEPRSILEDE
jgi:DNA-binding NtrC family response regulator